MNNSTNYSVEPNDGYCNICRMAWLRIGGMLEGQWTMALSTLSGMPRETFEHCSVTLHRWIDQFQKAKRPITEKGEEKMIIQGGSGKEFELCPEDTHVGVCADEVDLGWSESEFEGVKSWRHQMALIFQVDATDTDGNRFIIPKIVAVSTHPNSNLRKLVDLWRGKPFTDAEAKEFDTAKLIGINGMCQVVHKVKGNGRTRAEILSVTPLPKKTPSIQIENYTRPEWITKFMGKPERPANGSGADEPVPF